MISITYIDDSFLKNTTHFLRVYNLFTNFSNIFSLKIVYTAFTKLTQKHRIEKL